MFWRALGYLVIRPWKVLALISVIVIWLYLPMVPAQMSSQDMQDRIRANEKKGERMADQIHDLQIKAAVHDTAGHGQLVTQVNELSERVSRLESVASTGGLFFSLLITLSTIMSTLVFRRLGNGKKRS